ncbi:MAG: cupin domain-containing protein [Planctomycetes bacterium]|nr:cupin domain-containing protein [Planctomycetota bacterium]
MSGDVPQGNVSKVLRRGDGFTWAGVPLEPYKPTTETYRGVTRRELVGKRGESPRFHLRYFEVAPGGFTTYERHEHEHVVYVVRGRGVVLIGEARHEVGVGDVVYVAPGDPHQFGAPAGSKEPFGFLCIVNAERDRPVAVEGYGVCDICV